MAKTLDTTETTETTEKANAPDVAGANETAKESDVAGATEMAKAPDVAGATETAKESDAKKDGLDGSVPPTPVIAAIRVTGPIQGRWRGQFGTARHFTAEPQLFNAENQLTQDELIELMGDAELKVVLLDGDDNEVAVPTEE